MQVLEHEDDRLVAAEAVEQREQRLEQARLAALALIRARGAQAVEVLAELRHQLGEGGAGLGRERLAQIVAADRQLAGDGAQRVEQRGVGDDGAAELQAVADEDLRPRARVGVHTGARLELGDQAALADARLAGDEGERRHAAGRPLEHAVQDGELLGATDERGRGEASQHALHSCLPGRVVHGAGRGRHHARPARTVWRGP